MVQSLNPQGIWALGWILHRPSLLVPHVSVQSISHISYSSLRDHFGVQAVVFDKDNTVTAPYRFTTHSVAEWGAQQALGVFGPENVAILSNSAGTLSDDPNDIDAVQTERGVGIRVIRHVRKKPSCLPEVLQHFGMSDPSRICMVGDRILTDVVFGNHHGMLTVHCQPVAATNVSETNLNVHEAGKDNAVASSIRSLENILLYQRAMQANLMNDNARLRAIWKRMQVKRRRLWGPVLNEEDWDLVALGPPNRG